MVKSSGFARLFGCGLLLLSSLVEPTLEQSMDNTTASSTVSVPMANGTTTLPVVPGSSSVSVIITTPPANMTVATGSTVTLNCGISNQYAGAFYWQTYRGSTLGSGLSMQIYTCTSTSTSCPVIPAAAFSPPQAPYNKYTQSNMYGLSIAEVDWRDGARYACNFLVGDVSATATVVVIEEVRARFIESDVPLSMSDGSMVTPGELECVVTFGAPIFSVDDLDRSNRMPQLSMTFNGLTYSANVSSVTPLGISQMINIMYEPGKPREILHTLRMTVARNLTVADIGKQMTCTAMTKNPSFTSSTPSTYSGASLKPWDIEIEKPENPHGVVYVDDIVNCTVTNHPDAIVRWFPVSNSNVTLVDSENLVVSEEMIGENVWDCVVYDWSERKKNTMRFAFNVTENPNSLHGTDESSEEEAARRRVALGVGLGIGLGLPILIVIIVIIVLLLKKRKSGSASTKNGKPAAAAAGGYTSLPAHSEQLPPPIYQPKTNAAPPPRNASPSPSDEPSMNQSGHGDLGGIGFKPASLPSRSNSNLNTSLSGKPLISLGNPPAAGQPDSGPRPSGFADIGGGIGGRPPIAYADSQDSTSAASVPRSISMRSDASSVNPNRSGGPTYRTPQPRTGTATGV